MKKLLLAILLFASPCLAQYPFDPITGQWLSTNATGGVTAGYYAGSATPDTDAIRLGFFAGAGSPGPSSLLSAVAIGRHAGYAAEGMQSVFIGHAAGQYAGKGGDSSSAVILGYLAGRNATQWSPHYQYLSVVIGKEAATNSRSVQTSTILGACAGYNAINSSGSVIIGFSAGHGATNSAGSVLIGPYAGYNLSRNNTLIIESGTTYAGTNSLIYGEFDTRLLRFNVAKIGFLGAPAVARQVVNGSRSDGTAVAALLSALAALGLITDQTTP